MALVKMEQLKSGNIELGSLVADKVTDVIYIVGMVADDMYSLISLESGCRYDDPMDAQDFIDFLAKDKDLTYLPKGSVVTLTQE